MKTLDKMTLSEKINTMLHVVEDAEKTLSEKGITQEDIEAIDIVISDVFESIKTHFVTDGAVISADGREYPEWDGDAFYKALNNQAPGLSFRMDAVIDALEDLSEIVE